MVELQSGLFVPASPSRKASGIWNKVLYYSYKLICRTNLTILALACVGFNITYCKISWNDKVNKNEIRTQNASLKGKYFSGWAGFNGIISAATAKWTSLTQSTFLDLHLATNWEGWTTDKYHVARWRCGFGFQPNPYIRAPIHLHLCQGRIKEDATIWGLFFCL